jgi:hypothetical protein
MYFGCSGDISLWGVSLEVRGNFLWVKGIVSVVQKCEFAVVFYGSRVIFMGQGYSFSSSGV